MPTINLGKRKKRERTVNKTALQKFYNTPRWKRLRAVKFANNPLCERCLKKTPPVVRQTDEVHHKIPIDIMNPDPELIYCYDILESLCYDCHAEEQGKIRRMNPVEAQIESVREVR